MIDQGTTQRGWPEFLLWGAYSSMVIAGLLRHELWLDEAHHWVVPRYSEGLGDLARQLRYEGHPMLWNGLLFGLSRVTTSPLAMPALHGLIIVGAMGLLIFRSPFPLWMRGMLPFSYFFLFEYGLLSRNYALGVLLAAGACLAFSRRHYLGFGALLFLLANSHLLGLVLAALLALVALADRPTWRSDTSTVRRRWLTGGLVFVLGTALALWQIIPPADHPQLQGWSQRLWPAPGGMSQVLLLGWESLFPIPDWREYHFWHTNWLENQYLFMAKAGGGLCLLLPVFLLRYRPSLYLLPFGMAAGVFLLQLYLGHNYARHYGFVFLALVCAGWLLPFLSGKPLPPSLWRIRYTWPLAVVLAAQLAGGAIAYRRDWRQPFSESRRAATFIRQQGWEGRLLVAEYCFGEPLGAYLERPLFYPEQPEACCCQWAIFDAAFFERRNAGRFLQGLAVALAAQPDSTAIFVHYRPLETTQLRQSVPGTVRPQILAFEEMAVFDEAIKTMENYYLYRVSLEE